MGPKRRKKRSARAVGHLVPARRILEMLAISERTLQRMVGEGLPVAQAGRGGRASHYDPVAVQAWWKARQEEEDEGNLEDPAVTSPWLEKWREERHRDAKRRNDIAEGRLLQIETARGELQVIFGRLRIELEAVGRVHGPTVADAIRDAIERAEKSAEEKFPAPKPEDPPPPPAPEAKKEGGPQP